MFNRRKVQELEQKLAQAEAEIDRLTGIIDQLMVQRRTGWVPRGFFVVVGRSEGRQGYKIECDKRLEPFVKWSDRRMSE